MMLTFPDSDVGVALLGKREQADFDGFDKSFRG